MHDKARTSSVTDYDALRAAFAWDIHATFNFGGDVVDHLARTANGPALIWRNEAGDEKRFDFADISRLSSRFANVLKRQGIAKGDKVLVMLPRRPEWTIAMTGIMKLGAIPIPSIEMLTARDVEYRIANAGARAAVCRAEHAPKFASVLGDLTAPVSIGPCDGWLDWTSEMDRSSDDFEPVTMHAEDPAIMYYTSGSTGHPKAVIHAARGLFAWRVTAQYWLDVKPDDTIWCTADTGWSKAATSILIGPWSCGACSVFYDGPFDAMKRLELLDALGVTVYCASSTELSRIVDIDVSRYDLSKLRRVVTAGESLNPAVANRFEQAVGVRIDEAYGQTECQMVTASIPGGEIRYGSMGRAAPGCDLDVIDGDGNRLPPGEEGDVALLTPNPQIMLGYWQDEERTESIYLDSHEGRWLLTGDRAAKDEDGFFWFRGRSDDVINSAGYRIGPLEVENALLEHSSVQMCAVVGSPDTERGEIVKAFVVLRPGTEPSPDLTSTLQTHVKSVTAPYKYPRAIEFVTELPTTLTGKIRRRTLRDREYEKARTP